MLDNKTIETMEAKDTCLYIHTRENDGGIFYVGIGNKKRPYTKDSRSKHWHNIVKKHGYNVTIMVENLTWSEACELEVKMIAFYGRIKPYRKNPNYGCLINKTDGGDGAKGNVPSKETRQKLSKALKGKKKPEGHGENVGKANKGVKRAESTKQKITEDLNKRYANGWVNPMTGRNHTDEVKQTHSKLMKGRYVGSKNASAKTLLDKETGVYHECIKELAEVLGRNYSGFLRTLQKQTEKGICKYLYV